MENVFFSSFPDCIVMFTLQHVPFHSRTSHCSMSFRLFLISYLNTKEIVFDHLIITGVKKNKSEHKCLGMYIVQTTGSDLAHI